jgi:hypothetical protein
MVTTPNIFTDTRYEARSIVYPQTPEGAWEALLDKEGNPIMGDDFHDVLEMASNTVNRMMSEGDHIDMSKVYIAIITTTCVPVIHFEKPNLDDELDWIREYRKLTNTDYKTAKEAYSQRRSS